MLSKSQQFLRTERVCRDIVWLIAFTAFAFAMIMVADQVKKYGNPMRLVAPFGD